MIKWEYSSVVLNVEKKGFAVSRKDLLKGLDDDSVATLTIRGNYGWELVSVIPFMTGTMGMFSDSKSSTDALLGFMKRPLS